MRVSERGPLRLGVVILPLQKCLLRLGSEAHLLRMGLLVDASERGSISMVVLAGAWEGGSWVTTAPIDAPGMNFSETFPIDALEFCSIANAARRVFFFFLKTLEIEKIRNKLNK